MLAGTSVWWGATLVGVGEPRQKVGATVCQLTTVMNVPVPGSSRRVPPVVGCMRKRRQSGGQHS
jgi:hypothetical protein